LLEPANTSGIGTAVGTPVTQKPDYS